MNIMKQMLEVLDSKFGLKKVDVGEFSKLKVNGMNFVIEQYYAKGLGNVSVMTASGFFGLMKMDTLIVNPTEQDLPLFSYDRIHAMGNDTLILELYDTILNSWDGSRVSKVKEDFAQLPDHDLGSHWYDEIKLAESVSKKGKKKETPSFDKLTREYFQAYVEGGEASAACQETAKKEKASVYVEGLLKNGGPSTDIFKKHFGEEKTAYLFSKILFGTE